MDRSVVIYLQSFTQAQNKLGQWEKTVTRRKVYAEVSSVGMNEWFEGGRNGLNPQYRFKVFQYDYNGETELEYDGKIYAIYRTYVDKHELIELYTEEKKGSDQ